MFQLQKNSHSFVTTGFHHTSLLHETSLFSARAKSFSRDAVSDKDCHIQAACGVFGSK